MFVLPQHVFLFLIGVSLLCAADKDKDQTFFLSQIQQWALQRTIFPLGNLTKKTVKEIAASAGMEKLALKKESMGICFIGSRNFQDFIEEYIEPRQGNFIDIETDTIVGTHKGTHYWTLGQRCNLGGLAAAYFVAQINPVTQDIHVAAGTDHPALFSETFQTGPVHWIKQNFYYEPPVEKFDAMFRFQHKHPLIGCSCSLRDDGGYNVTLARPMRAVTPGQYAVFYCDDTCLGSARILSLGPSLFQLGVNSRIDIPLELS
ncbi:mitochondrial tRNA-specific 2-thiouridylase 1-like [Elysia marginata]|uniref:tRNA-5-taurinomethyluridine 2-sulfurtransferase n=1 Tax=Elysia marginata TaxID=1093978 RepID=A0AAV4IBJ8_9GAST|nr:mitochondrial tRNA-specific 2-thiouridylase 1-like [Elysia marginata]